MHLYQAVTTPIGGFGVLPFPLGEHNFYYFSPLVKTFPKPSHGCIIAKIPRNFESWLRSISSSWAITL